MGFLGQGDGNTLLILTDAESRLIREVLSEVEDCGDNRGIQAFNRGIVRGTAKITEEFAALQKAKRNK